NEAQVIGDVEHSRGTARVFGFGIGSSVNRYLIEGVARAGRGTTEYVVGSDEPPDAAAARLYHRIDRPILTDLAVDFEGAAVSELLPERMPDLFAGQPLVVVGRLKGSVPSSAQVLVRGRLGDAPYTRRIPFVVNAAPTGAAQGPVVGTLWARRR